MKTKFGLIKRPVVKLALLEECSPIYLGRTRGEDVTTIKSSDFILIVYILMTFRVIGHDVGFCFLYPDESTWHGFFEEMYYGLKVFYS